MLRFAVLTVFLLATLADAASHSSSGPHIADVNILLPPKMTYPVEYRLQGSDGCFKWSWDHHDILSVQPEYNSSNRCSTSARLQSIAPFSGRKETAVYAADVHTGVVIRCKVFIDNISRIQIFHNSIKLDLDGLATLRVRAFDAQDNVFSSLVGLQFVWELTPGTDGLQHHLAHVPLKDSPLSDCGGLCGDLDIQIGLEESGVFSDLFVVKGVEIGQENVAVQMAEPQNWHMGDTIVLTVAEAMSLEPPSPVFVLIGAAFHYTLKVIRGNIPQVVALPSPHHRWLVSNSSVAEVDSMMGTVHALSLGVTAVFVEDTRVAGHMQVSSLNVVLPDSLVLYMMPLSVSGDLEEGIKPIPSSLPWYVVSGRQYLIAMKVFSQGPDAHEIYITESDDLNLNEDRSQYWNTFLPSEDILAKHGWRNSRILRATYPGVGKVIASLAYFGGQQNMKVVQEIIVCDQVKFSLNRKSSKSDTILLPWAPNIFQEMELKATGGCAKASSEYKWFSSDIAILAISNSGVVQAKRHGKATVKVASVFDSLNYDEVVIEVSVPSSMMMLQNLPVETVVGSHLLAAVTMKASNGLLLSGDYFHRCDAFHSFITWKAGHESFAVLNATKFPPFEEKLETGQLHDSIFDPPCSWTRVYASSSGETMLHATLSKEYHTSDRPFYGSLVLKASSRIAAYQPLSLHQVGDGNSFGGYWYDFDHHQLETLESLYLVPETSLDVILLGGPERWDKDVDFVETVELLDDKQVHIKDGVHVQKVSNSHENVYKVSCQTLGMFKLIFKRGNLVGNGHPLPAIAEVGLFLTCSFPSSISLVVDEPVNKHDVIRAATLADRNTGRIRATPVIMANGRTIRIAAVGIYSSGETFANSSSLSLEWELSNCEDLAFWDYAYESKRSKSNWERFLVLQNETGQCIVRASVFGLGDAVDPPVVQRLENILEDAIRLELVSTLRVYPEFNLLYFNPNAKVNLSVTGGSCLWEAAVNDSQVVEVIQSSPVLQCFHLMLSPKGLGTAVVTIYDIGLTPPITASATVQVVDVDWIKIAAREEISLMEGESRSIGLEAGVNGGNTFDSSQFAYMNIHVFLDDDIVELVGDDAIAITAGEFINAASFRIIAKQLGVTTLYVSVRQQSGHEIRSQPIKLEVYAPLGIHPHDIFLVPGASYMLTVKGGPTIGVYTKFASADHGIAVIDQHSGKLSAISPGNTTMHATVYGNEGVAISEAYGIVKVGVPSLAILNTQSEQLNVGREMPIYPSLSDGDLFSFYELCKGYKWSIDDDKVLSFHAAEKLQGEKQWFALDEGNELGFIKVLYGRSAGRANVAVKFSCDFASTSYSQSRVYDASISLIVVPDLPLALGAPITWILPPHYVTSKLLPSSLESHSQWDSQNRKGSIAYSILRSCEKNEAWQKDAISIDGDRIKTMEANNVACIQAKDRTTGRIEIATCVKVAEVVQLRVSNKELPNHVIYVAVGAELDLPISFFDALGNPFYEAHDAIPYHAETNYHNIVCIDDIGNHSGRIHIKAMRLGRALLRVSMDSNPQKSDYVLILVGAHVYPQNPILRHGSSLNFSVEGSDAQASGLWRSANESVIDVDMHSGKADAVGLGSTQVFYESPSMKLQTVVTVSGHGISIDAPKEILTNVPYPMKGYSFPVRFSDYYNKVGAVGVPYDCKVDPPIVGYAKPGMDLDTNSFYCHFFPYSPEHLLHSASGLKEMKPFLTISVNASLREARHISDSASAMFVGGFSILEMHKNSMQLNLTSDSNKTVITILGNTDVDFHWLDPKSMKIDIVRREGFGIGGLAQFEVKVLGSKSFKDKIIFTLRANGQRAEIDINYELSEPAESRTNIKNAAKTLLLALFWGMVLIFGTVFAGWKIYDRFWPFAPPATTATSSIREPQTPVRGSPASSEMSPRTPQPFVDYVRKTIDETPYYRREARRRFNPQNTY
ncbi:hypothetical protein Tsubulata_004795 [Turnera subulata]|uniref:BIG2 domain-containing protein n=1 Tax=Turnera subulata TaxID=218843 RepID=A0A9Q0FBC0_9ROSI|nr:hypothetical protein Tsubulata_004795 [Turnera subulata]